MKDDLKGLLEVRDSDYRKCFSTLTHSIILAQPPTSTLRLHYVSADAAGEPDFKRLAHVLARYITIYCFTAQRRRDLSELERNELFMEARKLFRDYENSGQAGEILVYFLLETVLGAPQVLKKMPMTTNPKEERKGSDGVHLRWNEAESVLDIIFAESKLQSSFSAALKAAITSIDKFHSSENRELEIKAFTANFNLLPPQIKEHVISYVDGEESSSRRYVQSCLIGFDWEEYKCLDDHRRSEFVAEFEKRYGSWAAKESSRISMALSSSGHKGLHFEFFLLPFRSVADFRKWFNSEL